MLILNREAIALAADSAATLTGEKIFSSANKIFRLRSDLPVGLMIYNRADFLGIPWETVIGLYRKNDNGTVSPDLSDYGVRFIEFLSSLVTPEIEINYIQQQIMSVLGDICHEIAYTIEFIERNYTLGEEEKKEIVQNTINCHHNLWESYAVMLPLIEDEDIQYVVVNYSNYINESIELFYASSQQPLSYVKNYRDCYKLFLIKFPKLPHPSKWISDCRVWG